MTITQKTADRIGLIIPLTLLFSIIIVSVGSFFYITNTQDVLRGAEPLVFFLTIGLGFTVSILSFVASMLALMELDIYLSKKGFIVK